MLALLHSVRYHYSTIVYTLLHLILINYCGTGCIRRLGKYKFGEKHTLIITERKVLFHVIPAVYFVDSALQSHCHSLTQPH